MADPKSLSTTFYEGWHDYQNTIIAAITPLTPDQLALRASPNLRTLEVIITHIIGARAGWFHQLMGEGGDEFDALRKWDHDDAPHRTAAELVTALEATWDGMHTAIDSWTEKDWAKTWPGVGDYEPKLVTRHWVIWHLIEHDLHHGGEISLTLGIHGIPALDL